MSEPTRNGTPASDGSGAAPGAGPELDTRLFDAFFGDRPNEPVPRFSADISTAWILVQRLLKEHGWVEVAGTDDGRWICRVHDPSYRDLRLLGSVVGEASTAPLAICRAALRIAEAPEGGRAIA